MELPIRDAKARLSELVAAARKGERVIITRHGQPTAELVRCDRRGGIDFDKGTDQITVYFLYTFSETRRATPPRHRTLGAGQGSDVRARLGAPDHASTGEGG